MLPFNLVVLNNIFIFTQLIIIGIILNFENNILRTNIIVSRRTKSYNMNNIIEYR